MGPNDAELIRVFTQGAGATIADVTFPTNAPFDIVVEVEAGTAIHGSGAQFKTNIVVRDLTANANIAAAPAGGVSGAMSSPAWPSPPQKFVYTVAAAALAGKDDHLCQVISFLSVGVTNPDTSFAESPLFLLTSP